MNDALFALPSDAYKVTSDDCYTPRWVFDAMGLRFDLDKAVHFEAFTHERQTHPVVQGEGHPTVKPLPIVADWVRLFSDPGDVILDPFAGSGTTLRAAKDEGRKAIGVELDESYCEVIAKRLTQDTLFGGVA